MAVRDKYPYPPIFVPVAEFRVVRNPMERTGSQQSPYKSMGASFLYTTEILRIVAH